MPGIAITNIGDFLRGTLQRLPNNFNETFERVSAPLTKSLIDENGDFNGEGKELRWDVRLRLAANSRFANVGEARSVSIEDVTGECVVPIAFADTQRGYFTQEMVLNSGPQRIYDHLKARRSAAVEDLVFKIEDALTFMPYNSSVKNQFLPLEYYFPTLAAGSSDPVGGFNGTTVTYGDASTTTTIANQDRSLAANTRLRSWVGTRPSDEWDDATEELLTRALNDTNFSAISDMGQFTGNKSSGPTDMVFLGLRDYENYEKRVNKGPDDKGSDTRRFYRGLTFRGVPLVPTPSYDSIAYKPMWGVSKRWTRFRRVKGFWWREGEPMNSKESQHTWVVQTDCWGQLEVGDVRGGGFCIHKTR